MSVSRPSPRRRAASVALVIAGLFAWQSVATVIPADAASGVVVPAGVAIPAADPPASDPPTGPTVRRTAVLPGGGVADEGVPRLPDDRAPSGGIDAGGASAVAAADHAPGVVLVGFRPGTPAAAKALARRAVHAADASPISPLARDIEKLQLPPGRSVEAAVTALGRNPNVRFAEPDYRVAADAISDDTLLTDGTLWGMLSGTGTPSNQYGSGARTAWAAGFTGSRDVVVGIIDEGIQVDHRDLSANIWTNPWEIAGNGRDDDGNGYVDDIHGWDFKNDDATVYDGPSTDSHGTHVAGTIGGVGGNGTGVAGVNWAVTMISAKFLEGSGNTSDAVAALDYLTDLKVRHGLKIVATNNSWGGGEPSQALTDAINRAGDRGMLFVAAAGNAGADSDATPIYPAASGCTTRFDTGAPRGWDCIVSVAAIGSTGDLARFSNYGLTSVDLGAPGVGIASTYPPDAYASLDGTSMAAPHVTGAIALLAACNGALDATALRGGLMSSAAATTSLAGRTVSGARLDVAAMTSLCDTSGPPSALLVAPSAWVTGPSFVVKAWFSRPVTGLAAADFTLAGTASGWSIGGVTGSGMGPYTITVVAAAATDGTLTLTLKAGSVSDGTLAGPPAAVKTPPIRIDRTPPVVGTPVATPASVAVDSATRVTANATDGTSIASAALRVDGGAWQGMGALDGAFDESSESLAALVGGRVVQVSNASDGTCALLSNGTVRCWGDNTWGQLGPGTTAPRSNVPIEVAGLSGVVSISSGYAHVCAVLVGGSVRCWGFNGYGQLGNGTTSFLVERTPVTVTGITNAVAVSAGLYSSCALLADGTVRCWGLNGGQLGDGTTADRTTPVRVVGLSSAIAVSAGSNSTCALISDGTVRCWGNGLFGVLGDGSGAGHLTPAPVSGITTATAIANSVGGHHACAVLATGTVWCWGEGSSGALGNGSNTQAGVPVQALGITTATAVSVGYDFSCALLADQTAWCWGANDWGQLGRAGGGSNVPVAVAGLDGATSHSANGAHACVVDTAAALRCWGLGFSGQLGDGLNADRPTNATATGLRGPLATGDHIVCVRAADAPGGSSDGTACTSFTVVRDVTPPQGAFGRPASPANALTIAFALGFDEPVTGLAAGDLALVGTSPGCSVASVTGRGASYAVAVAGCGEGTVGLRLGAGTVADPAGNPGPSALVTSALVTIDRTAPAVAAPSLLPRSSSADHAVTVTAAIGDPSTVTAADVRIDGGAWAPMDPADGSFDGVAETATAIVNVVSTATAVAAGGEFSCALLAGGTVRCWGENGLHQLGDGTTVNRLAPVTSVALEGVVAIAAGGRHACALLAGGTLRCWGANDYGQLGSGWGGSSAEPLAVEGISNAVSIAAGGMHTCAVLQTGEIRCWGNNDFGSLGNGSRYHSATPVSVSGIGTAVAISAGFQHTCAVLGDGTARCWGYGTLGDGVDWWTRQWSTRPVVVSGLTGATAIGAGHDTACAIVAGGAVRCWGSGADGEMGDGSTGVAVTPVTVSGVSGAVSLAVGGHHACVALAGGSVRCWGRNRDGQLGDGTTTSRSTPVAVTGIATTTRVAAASLVTDVGEPAFHTCAVLADGTVDCWGANGAGALGDGTTSGRAVPGHVAGIERALDVGDHAVCVRATDGTGTVSAGSACSILSIALDTEAPAAVISSPASPTRSAVLTYAVVFNEPVTGLEAGDLGAAGSAAGCIIVTPEPAGATAYTVRVSGCGEGTVVLYLRAGSVTDRAANAGPVTEVTSDAVTIDRTPAGATLTAPATPTTTAVQAYVLTFSEPVTGLGPADLARTGTAAGCVVGAPAGLGTSFSVTVSGCGTGTLALALRAGSVVDAAGNVSPAAAVAAAVVTIDRSTPTTTRPALTARLRASTSGTSTPYVLAWSGQDTGSGIVRYKVERSLDGGTTWTTLTSTLTLPSLNVSLASGLSYRFRVRAIDGVGHVGSVSTGPTVRAGLVQQTATSVRFAGRWSVSTSSSFSGGSARSASAAGASVSYTFSGRSIAFVSTLAKTRGRARIYIDGQYVTRVDLTSTTTIYRGIAFRRTWPTSGTHTIRIVVEGTAGRPRVDVDAFAVLR